MGQSNNYSISNFLKGALLRSKVKLSTKEFNKINAIVHKAEFHCCNDITVYWINNLNLGGSKAVPSGYQLQFKDVDGNIIAQTNLTGSSPQTVKIPDGSYNVCLNVVEQLSNGLPGSGFTVAGTTPSAILTNTDGVGEYCVGSLFQLDEVYIIRSMDGSPI